MSKLARLKKVEITDGWKDEAQNFTPWLADEGLPILAETLGLNLQIVNTEVPVGNFRADVHARNTADDTDVVIENQFGKSDHKHLGQVLTYAAGITPKTIIWIAETFTEEHIDALNYLNKITKKRFRFFGVTITLYRIGNSDIVPLFQIACKPQNWTYETQRVENETKQLQMKYWTALSNLAVRRNSPVRFRKPYGKNFIDCEQRDKVKIGAYHNINRKEIGVSLYIEGKYLNWLKEQCEASERELYDDIGWDHPSQIYLSQNESDPRDESQWEKQHQWLLEKLELFNQVFRPMLHKLNAAEKNPNL